MSRFNLVDRMGGSSARRALEQRLLREQMGDEAFEKMIAQNDDRAFRIFGLVFIVVFGVIVFAITALGS